ATFRSGAILPAAIAAAGNRAASPKLRNRCLMAIFPGLSLAVERNLEQFGSRGGIAPNDVVTPDDVEAGERGVAPHDVVAPDDVVGQQDTVAPDDVGGESDVAPDDVGAGRQDHLVSRAVVNYGRGEGGLRGGYGIDVIERRPHVQIACADGEE